MIRKFIDRMLGRKPPTRPKAVSEARYYPPAGIPDNHIIRPKRIARVVPGAGCPKFYTEFP